LRDPFILPRVSLAQTKKTSQKRGDKRSWIHIEKIGYKKEVVKKKNNKNSRKLDSGRSFNSGRDIP
jgi:hypothetical protein